MYYAYGFVIKAMIICSSQMDVLDFEPALAWSKPLVQRNVILVKFVVDCCNLDRFAGRPTRVRKMTDGGREFTVHLKRKAALKGKEEFRLQLVSFEKSVYDISNPDFIRSELQKLKSLSDNEIQGFIDWMNLTVEAEEMNEISRQQYELQSSWEKVRATAPSRLEFLEVKEETKSNSVLRIPDLFFVKRKQITRP